MLLQELARAPSEDLERAWQKRLQPGDAVGRFEILREIARGGFGVVYEALDRQLGRSVALKTLRPARTGHELSVEWILKEAEAVARLDHPAIVILHDVGRCEWGPYLVEQLLHGRTLEERLQDGPLPEGEAVTVGLELARGLAHAHERGVLHRDLKPGNVFLTEDGRVKLLDFGLAHLLGTRGVQGAGTPAYMAPEQLRGEAVNARADVFALGATLFEALAGRAPFEVKEGRSAALDEGPAPALPEGTAAPLARLLGRCLSRDPATRPANGQAVIEELLAIQRAFGRAGLEGRVLPAGNGPATVVPDLPSIAVLPFADMSAQHDQEYFADGVAEEILNALAQVPGLKVIGRTSSFSFKGKSEDLRTIGRKLSVRALLEGSVRKEGNHLRVTAQLVGAEDGSHLWSQIFDRDQAGVFAVQEEIAQAVVAALRVKLLSAGVPLTREVRTGNSEVYRLCLLGRDLGRRGRTLDEWKRALTAYEQALALDPEYAPAWAGVALALTYIEGAFEEGTSSLARRKRALDAADRAIALASDLPDGYWVRADIRMGFAYDWQGADADLKRARTLGPSDADVATISGLLFCNLGRFTEAIDVLRRATALDPLSAVAWARLGLSYTFAGDLDRGREALRSSLDVVPEGAAATLYYLIVNLMLAGRPAEALAAARRCSLDWIRTTGEALALKDLGRREEARAALERLITEHRDVAAYQIAEVLAWDGERDRAFEWLERAYSQRDPGVQYTRADPLLRRLHDDTRWKPFLHKLNLPVD